MSVCLYQGHACLDLDFSKVQSTLILWSALTQNSFIFNMIPSLLNMCCPTVYYVFVHLSSTTEKRKAGAIVRDVLLHNLPAHSPLKQP